MKARRSAKPEKKPVKTDSAKAASAASKRAPKKSKVDKVAQKRTDSVIPRKAAHAKATAKNLINPDPSSLNLAKYPNNPIIGPRQEYEWEAWQTFNPGVILLNNKVHFLYRAIGSDGISRIGYAVSRDGFAIDERLPYPIYAHRVRQYYYNVFFPSGGGWGGVEDPRLTLVDGRLYLFHVLLDGIPQLAVSSIAEDDFTNRRWKWSQAAIISPPGVVVKSGCLFPEKIGGKYAILYRIFPDIWIDYVDSLEFPNGQYLNGRPVIHIRKQEWDSRKIGAGAPPIKTPYGWLLIYYAVDERDVSKYKIGAMILDSQNPEHVLHRTSQPILGPTEWYENNGHKSGIAYPCGAVVKDGNLLIYYGGADSYVCVASTNFNEFVDALRNQGKPKLVKGIVKMKRT